LARAMLRGYPGLLHRADTDDVFQGAVMRLLAAVRQIHPTSTADFFNLAAAHVRRELLDLARYFARRRAEQPPGGPAVADDAPRPERLELWGRLHEAIAALPAEERETVSLAYYHGWTHEQIAAVLGVTDRSVRRYWRSACQRLSTALGDGVDELLA